MALKKQRITLEIVWDDSMAVEPVRWDWTDLLDLGPEETVEIVSANTPQNPENRT